MIKGTRDAMDEAYEATKKLSSDSSGGQERTGAEATTCESTSEVGSKGKIEMSIMHRLQIKGVGCYDEYGNF